MTDTYSYTAYGSTVSTSGSDVNPFQYGGKFGYYTENNGVILCGHRWYDTLALRWLSRDPAGYEGGDNLYAYCGDNPLGGIDPNGTQVILAPPTVPTLIPTPPVPIRSTGKGGIIVAGAEAIDELLHNSTPGHPTGPFTAFGDWLGDKIFPGSYGFPASPNINNGHGQQNQRDSGLTNLTDDQIMELADDTSLTPAERLRYQKEEKARGLRNVRKRKGKKHSC